MEVENSLVDVQPSLFASDNDNSKDGFSDDNSRNDGQGK